MKSVCSALGALRRKLYLEISVFSLLCWTIPTKIVVVVVVIEYPQTLDDDLKSARAARGRRTRYLQLVHVCS